MVILLAIGVFSSFIASISSTLNTLRMSRVENSKHLDVDFPHGCCVGEMDGWYGSVPKYSGKKTIPQHTVDGSVSEFPAFTHQLRLVGS